FFLGHSCHYKIHSYTTVDFNDFRPPFKTGDSLDYYIQPTPYKFVERLYLSKDSNFLQVVTGSLLNLSPVYGQYQIKGKKLILYPDRQSFRSSQYIDKYQDSSKNQFYLYTARIKYGHTWTLSQP